MEIEIDNILNAANYEKIADYSIVLSYNKLFDKEILNKNCIIFCKTDDLNYLFDNIRESNKKYLLITHHSDYPIDNFRYSKKPNSIHKWFAINPTHICEDLISIPLGLKTHKDPFYEPQYMTKWFVQNIQTLKNNKKEFTIYCNWNLTNPNRKNILNILNKNKLPLIYQSNLSFDEYAINMSKSLFVISPPGNGIDCHRTWESLYLGCIPIVIDNYIYDDWTDLPILKVKSYEDLNEEILINFLNKKYNYDKLYLNYWKDRIKKYHDKN
jgi:hypothetical protein